MHPVRVQWLPVRQHIQINGEKKMTSSFLVEHNIPFNVADHLVPLLKSLHLDKDSLAKTTCGRTKATKLVTNVIGMQGRDNMIGILQNTKFSIIIDESTDIATTKNLAIMVRFYRDKKVHDRFLDIIEIADGSAQNIYNVL